MKKTWLVITVLGVAVLVLGVAGFAYAQSGTPEPFPGGGYGPGMMGGQGYGYGRGMMGEGYSHGRMGGGYGFGMMGEGYGEMGALHDYMFPAMASALGLTPEEFDTRHDAGETFWEIAEAQGFTPEEAWDLMLDARNDALQNAVTDGVITQEFADWMLDHMDAMHGDGFGPGSGHCDGEGHRGSWGNGL